MAFEHVWIYSEVELLALTTGPMQFSILTELPSNQHKTRTERSFDTLGVEMPARIQFAAPCKGRILQVRIDGAYTCRLYGARIKAKRLGTADAWRWYSLPVKVTPEAFASTALPIAGTPEGWAATRLPLRETPEGWASTALPIAGTPEGWNQTRVPFEAASAEWTWRELPVDA